MLKNYFKIAIAVLRRKKFFTFISLFGISYTLTILIVVAAFVDQALSAGYPDTNRDRELFVSKMHLRSTKSHSNINGGPSFYFLKNYVSTLKIPVKISIASGRNATSTYINNKKLKIYVSYTNDQFWDVLQVKFIEGKPYNKQQIDNSEKVAVISEETRNNYFGKGVSVVGKYIETDDIQYRVSGVFKNIPFTSNVYSDVFVPYTLSKEDIRGTGLLGGFNAILLLNSEADVNKAKEEYNQMNAKVPMNEGQFDLKYTFADSYLESFTRSLPFGETENSGVALFLLIVTLLFLLFLLLPTLNLVNINISRIMDRYSEIGVRKAFGASSKTLVYQFLVENLILTFIGNVIGILLALIAIRIMNGTAMMQDLSLVINLKVIFFSLVATLVFGMLSGVYPAWRMSRMHVVSALKEQ